MLKRSRTFLGLSFYDNHRLHSARITTAERIYCIAESSKSFSVVLVPELETSGVMLSAFPSFYSEKNDFKTRFTHT
jgi:hypothetical protein